MNLPGILICLSFFFCMAVTAEAQNQLEKQRLDTIPALSVDSALLQQPDSIWIDIEDVEMAVMEQDSVPTRGARGERSLVEVTSDKFFAPSHMFSPSPRKAVIYSAIFPGLGQVYNRKYWKLPILYGGFVGLTYAITWNNGYYQDYLGAYKDIMDDDPASRRWVDMLPYGQTAESVDMQWFTNVLQQRKDYYRYYRDLSIIGTIAVYLAAIVDAYVDAQLFDFDMSPDLSMRMAPVIIREQQSYKLGGSSYGVQLSFNF